MSIFSYQTLKNIMFKLQPETAHTIASVALRGIAHCPMMLKCISKKYFITNPIISQKLLGTTFANPVGLGAGFDKNGQYITSMPTLGFGYTEIGTVTPLPQDGNPKPRLFRLPNSNSLQNAMGFNNKGAEYMLKKLKKLYFFDYPIGINIGKNKLTSEEDALLDYKSLFETFKDQGDYMVINISSPNTPGLRDLQNEKFIKKIFKIAKKTTDKPVLLKIAPDMTPDDALTLCKAAVKAGAAGIIATNTTIDYDITDDPDKKDFGGISGELLKEKSYKLFEHLGKKLHDKTILISVGGIDSAEEAYRRILAGASLVQIYSMLIYKGPTLIRDINEGVTELLKADGFDNITQAIGSKWK